MAVIHRPARFAGFARFEPLEVWRAETTLGEAEPQAMFPQPQTDDSGHTPALAVASSGPLVPGTTIELLSLAPGYVGHAGFGWRRTMLAGVAVTEDYRGRDVPNSFSGQNSGGWASGTAVRVYPQVLTYPNGEQVVAASAKALAAATAWKVEIKTLNLTTGNYTTANDIVTGLSNTTEPRPGLVYIPREGLTLCAYWNINDDDDEAQIDIQASRDQGVTWFAWASAVLPAAVSTDVTTGYLPGLIQMGFVNGQLLLLADVVSVDAAVTYKSQIWQWASSDYGASFYNVMDDDDADFYRACPAIAVVGDKFYVAMYGISDTIGGLAGQCYAIGSAYEKVIEGEDLGTLTIRKIAIAAGLAVGADLSMAADDAGVLWIVSREETALGVPNAVNLSSWNPGLPPTPTADFVNDYGRIYRDGTTPLVDYPVNYSITWWRGQLHLVVNMVTSTGTFDDQWTRLEFGGFTSRTMPGTNNTSAPVAQASWATNTIACTQPETQDWSAPASAGTASLTTNLGWDTVTTTAGNQHYWQSADSFNENVLIMACARVLVTSGGSVAARNVMVGVRGATNAVEGYQAELWFSTTQIRLRDQNGASTIATVNADCANGVEVLIVQKAAEVVAYYRELETTNQDRYWTLIGSTNSLTDDVGAGGNGYVQFGNRTTSGAVAQYLPVRIYSSSYGEVEFTNPEDLWAAPYTSKATYIGDGLSIQSNVGPAAVNDSYLIYGDALYPARAAAPRGDDVSPLDIRGGQQPSPRPEAGWRSTATSGRLAYRPPAGLTSSLQRGVFVCQIEHPNFATAVVGYHDGATWQSFGTVDTRGTAISLPYVRTGARLILDPTGVYTNTPLLVDSELISGYAALSATKIRPIVGNRGGPWSLAGYGPRPTIDLDPASIDGTEPTTGTMDIWYPRVTFVAYIVPTNISGFSLYFGSTVVNYEGYIRAGLVCFGEGWLTSLPADWGMSLGIDTSALLDTLQTGQRISRTLSPSRSSWKLPFAGPLPRLASAVAHVYYPSTTANIPPFAVLGEDALTLRGLIEDSQGAQELVAYVPGLVAGPPNAYSLVSTQAAMVGRIVSEEWSQSLDSGNEQYPAWLAGVIELEQEL